MWKYTRVWIQLTKNAFSATLSNRLDAAGYFLGKLIRFIFFILLIQGLFRYTKSLVGYSESEVLLFFLTFNLVDVGAQAFFRGIYTFSWDIKRGSFDFLLMRPIHTLFYVMTKSTDLLDFLFLIPIVYLTVTTIGRLPHPVHLLNVFTYVLFIGISFIIVMGIHIFTAALTIRTVENENIIWLYRECMTIGRFPPEIFPRKVQFIFTYIVPVLVAVGFPVKALLGGVDIKFVLTTFVITILFFGGSIFFWKRNLKAYSSASS